ncbi:DUF6382 domain-containing protein [Alkaliphilus hydrothermalis]|uniref:FHA domain-containing protein n=1 Tax=Alkaliphilus hydrothermalis TaxID=1482730 RepID=A0ABS2NS86_9FIRM|nr:DUF6382 domain-containing protein [Alkaliphilus hydrothermalis]MBM7615818.1 hypothetical protein [Alkaliphilus hydrothermalis]
MEKEAKLPYEVTFESDVRGSYLVLKVNQEDDLYGYQVEMMLSNNIPSLLEFNLRQKDIYRYLYYNITSKLKLSNLLERRKLKKIELLEILIEILQGILAGTNFLLNYDGYCIQEEYIFIHPETLQISLLYIPSPMKGGDLGQELGRLINRLIVAVDPNEESSDNLLLKILYLLNLQTFTLEGFLVSLRELKGEVLRESTIGTKTRSKEPQEQLPSNKLSQYPPKNHMPFEEGKIVIKKDNKACKEYKANKDTTLKEKKGLKKETVVSKAKQAAKEMDYTNRTKLMILLSETLILITVGLIFLETTILKNPATGQVDVASLMGVFILVSVINYLLFKKVFLKERITVVKEVETVKDHPPNSKQVKGFKENTAYPKKGTYAGNLDTVLLVSSNGRPNLISVQGGIKEKKPINGDLFIVGKLKEQVDYVVPKKTVSRVHAEIRHVDGGYFLKDLNSRNGTYLNGERIQSNIDFLLKDEDRVTFADAEYIFSFEENSR